MPARRPHLLLLNASLAGETGNTAVLLARARRLLARHATVESITLAPRPDAALSPLSSLNARLRVGLGLSPQLHAALTRADGFLIGTGTHWDSWSSVLQKFLEDATATEATKLWLGKPAAVLVSEHSTGGKGVLSRLQGVLVTLGCSIPPMSGLVLSRAAVLAAQHAPDPAATRDFWCEDDLRVVCHNLAEAARITLPAARPGHPRWCAWPVDRRDFAARWI
ncbi:MAG: NAD(P)H-dependent oxidoreductase [Undibacterium sp.]|nr:NAD(P)H-dependent oxidoreductase [Opitutaceae bacterium]